MTHEHLTYTGREMTSGAKDSLAKLTRTRRGVPHDFRPANRAFIQAPGRLRRASPPDPGIFPYTRGIHATGYGGKLWTMRQFAGFGTPEETNARYRHLLAAGGTGLSVAFDLPTLMGRDPDHELSLGEVGKCGVSIVSLADMETLFDGIPLGQVTTSMTINSPAAMIFAMYLVVAERQGVPWATLSGTIQNDILKEFIAQKEYIYPAATVHAAHHRYVRLLHPPGAALEQHLGERLPHPRGRRDGRAGVGVHACATASSTSQYGIDAGLDVDAFAPRISFFFNAHSDFFEEIAKYRAARTIWAEVMRNRFGARSERSWTLRFHSQTAGVSLTAQQPHNNVVRTALQALSAVLGGTNSLHTNSLDEALALPTEEAATLALRTQQIIAHETGVASVVDPLGGSYFLESLTADLTREAYAYFDRIDAMGGMVAAIEQGFPQREVAESAYRFQQAVERKEQVIVGVNDFVAADEAPFEILYIDDTATERQMARLAEVKARRDPAAVARALDAMRRAAQRTDNLMPPILDAVRAYATLGEMCDALRDVWGEWEEQAII